MAQASKEPCKKQACDIQACLSKNNFLPQRSGSIPNLFFYVIRNSSWSMSISGIWLYNYTNMHKSMSLLFKQVYNITVHLSTNPVTFAWVLYCIDKFIKFRVGNLFNKVYSWWMLLETSTTFIGGRRN
uniref:Uncharacterized protein n=1 Tax=Solanum tuberosum TaxID=4113 RepID=M1CBT9_SOLTU